MVSLIEWAFLFSTVGFVLCGLDDLFIDLVALLKRLKPRALSSVEAAAISALPERRVAIIVPAWDEGDLIEHMLRGNIRRIDYENYDIFVGVYPNDPATCRAVERVSAVLPSVHAVVNTLPGPTSKGQMLNLVIEQVMALGQRQGRPFDVVLMQDSEDVIHPFSLKLINVEMESTDFLQTPVFSLPVRPTQLVGGTYMDEFAELHTKDLLVRTVLRGGVPSAGVGTALSRAIIERLLCERGAVFNEGSLTEDYELGLSCAFQGSRSRFVSSYLVREDGTREFIATREYFPKKVRRSIRQKTRWTIGIVMQGTLHLGWKGTFPMRYFLMRDRRGLFTNPLSFLGYVTTALAATVPAWASHAQARSFLSGPAVPWLLGVSLLLMLNRATWRAVCTARVYGWRFLPMLPFRWPLAVFINSCATVMAVFRFTHSRITEKRLQWGKTEHELPEFMTTQA